MIRIIGTTFVLMGCFVMGCAPVYRLKMRLKHLSAYMDMLGRMKQKLSVQQVSLPQLFLYLNGSAKLSANELCGAVYRTLSSEYPLEYTRVWLENISMQYEILSANEQDALFSVGRSIGKCSVEEQVYIISQAEHVLRESYDEEALKFNQIKRLYPSVSFSIGLMLVVALL